MGGDKMKKILFVSDLDGTLLNKESHISPRTAEIINKAISAGALFTIATARTPATVSKIIAPIHLRLPAIVMTGAALWNPDNGQYSNIKYFLPHTAAKLLDIYLGTGLPSFVYTLRNGLIHIYHLGTTSHIEQAFINERIHNPYKRFHLSGHSAHMIDDEALRHTILFYAMQPTAAAAHTYKQIVASGAECNPLFYHDIYGPDTAVLEAFAPEATKAEAVTALARKLGADEIIVFGDNINDLPMMSVATTSVAMANAIDQVKAQASCVIGCNNDDAVAHYIAARLGINI